MSPSPAARLTDPIEHGLGMLGMLAGMAIGLGLALAFGACVVATGGLAAAVLIGGAVAGGGLLGEQAAHGISAILKLSGMTSGQINLLTSTDTIIGNKQAARAAVDGAICWGLPMNHPPLPVVLIAEGSDSVYINNQPAARVGDKLVCGADIKQGEDTVIIGGGTKRLLWVFDLEAILHWVLVGVALLAAVIGLGLLIAGVIAGTVSLLTLVGVVAFAGASWGLGKLAHRLGDMIGPGWGDLFEATTGFISLGVGMKLFMGEPVDAVTGEVCLLSTDFELPAALPLKFERAYTSSLNQESLLGPNWCCTWGQSIWNTGADVVHYLAGDGRRIPFELKQADAEGWVRTTAADRIRLRATVTGFEVRNERNQILVFDHPRDNEWLLTAIADTNGNAISFNYESGALRTVEHTGGYRLRVTGSPNRIATIALEQPDRSLTVLVRYEYDAAGRLSGVDNGSGSFHRYEYDQANRLTRWSDREGTWYQYRYDELGRCVESVGPAGMYHYNYSYDPAQQTNKSIDSYGGVIQFRYNHQHRVVEQRGPLGGATITEWDERGRKLSVTDPEQRRIAYQYDAEGNIIGVVDALGRSTKIEYNQLGLPVVLTDPGARRWTRRYDERGNLIEAGLEGAAASWRYERDDWGNLVRIIDPAGRSRQFSYNNAGLPLTVSDWEGNVTRYSRDAWGRVVKETDPLENETRFAYNALNKLAQVALPNSATIRWDYDAEGNLLRRTGADGSAYSYSYGPFDLRQTVTRPSGSALRFLYDDEARLVGVENEQGEEWKYIYDLARRVIEERDFTGRVQRFEYDRSGLCIRRFNGKGEAIEIERNAAGQIIRRKAADGTETTFEYDVNGFVSKAVNPWITVAFERDEYGRVVREVQGERVVESSYDERGLRTRRRTTSGQETSWDYDANGRVQRVGLVEDQWLEFTRDAVGHDIERRLTQEGKQGGFVLRQDYDPVHRLVSQWAGMGAASPAVAAIAERQYRYDLNDNPTEIYDQHWGTSQYKYDADGRIASVKRDTGVEDEFRYDASGNINSVWSNGLKMGNERIRAMGVVEERVVGPGGRLERAGEKQYVYDDDGRVIEKRDGQKVWKYEWTSEGQLRSVVTPKNETWKYEYDAFGRRVRKIGPKQTTTYLWDGGVVAEEIHGTAASSHTASWIFQPGTFRPLAKVENGKSYACVTDQIGTPRELISANGEVAWSAQFTTWGEIESLEETATDCPIRFQGQWYDEESGLHYNWNRYYEAETGRYLSPDPIGINGGPRNYGYVRNPVSWVDPLGLADGDPLPPDAVVHRIGGGGVDNLGLSSRDLASDKPGLSVLQGGTNQQAADQMRAAFPKATGLQKASEVTGSATVQDIQDAGFNVVERPTSRFPNHAQIEHPDGPAGFTNENLQKLSGAFEDTNTPKCK